MKTSIVVTLIIFGLATSACVKDGTAESEAHYQAVERLAGEGKSREAIALELDEPLILYNRGLAYAFTGEYDKAIADYAKAIKLAPGLATA